MNTSRHQRTWRPSILVVDPDPAIRRLVEVVLRSRAHIVEATSVTDAQAKLDNTVDIVITELGVPTLEYEWITHLVDGGWATVVLTSHAAIEQLTAVDPRAYVITKPFRTDTLRDIIDAIADPFSRSGPTSQIEPARTS